MPLSDKDKKHIIALYRRGEDAKDIAANYGITNAYVYLLASKAGIKRGRPELGLTDKQRRDLGLRYAEGESKHSLAKEFGVNPNSVHNIAKSVGYSRGAGPGVMERFKERLNGKG